MVGRDPYNFNQFVGTVDEGGLATALTISYLQDTIKNWDQDQWKGRIIRLRGGNNNSFTTTIAGNNINQLFFVNTLPQQVESPVNTAYEILQEGSEANSGALSSSGQAQLSADTQAILAKLEETNLLLKQLLFAYTATHDELDYNEIRNMSDQQLEGE